MEIKKSCASLFKQSDNILCRPIYCLGEEKIHNSFALTECKIEAMGQSTNHQHDDQEIFLIKNGLGLMTIGSEEMSVSAGDTVYIPSNQFHSLKNISPTDDLLFYSISWLAPRSLETNHKNLVIPAPPTPNGPLHLGHLSGPYLAADVFTRFHNMLGIRSLLFMGTDDHQCYITKKARALDISDNQVLEKYKPIIKKDLNNFLVKPDEFIEPKDNITYIDFIKHFFNTLRKNNKIILKKSPTVYCNNTQKYIFGADVQGGCPNCNQPTLGYGCENCGHYNDCYNLKNLSSCLGPKPVSIVEEERYYFCLSECRDFLKDFLASCSMHPRLRNFYYDYLASGLPDVSLSNFFHWGIDVPDAPGQKIYEWMEMAGAYAFYLQNARSKLDSTFDSINLIEAFGFDNSFFYGLLVPALINAFDESMPKPKTFLSNYFYLYRNEKFSTSRNHAVWAEDFLKNHSPDNLRLYLSFTRAEDLETNFEYDDYKSFVKKHIIYTWGNLFNNINNWLSNHDQEWTAVNKLKGYQERFFNDAKFRIWEIQESLGYENFSLNNASGKLLEFILFITHFYSRYNYIREDSSINLSLVISSINAWAHNLSPIMPSLAKLLLSSFDLQDRKPNIFLNNKTCKITSFDVDFFNESKREIDD